MNQNRKPQCPGPFPQGIETAMAYGVPAQYGQQAKHKRLCRKASFNHWHQRVHTGKQHSRQQPDHPGRNTAFFHQQGKHRLTMVNTPLNRALGVRNQIFHSNDTRSAVAWTWERMMSATCRRSSKSMLSQFPRWEDRYSIFCGETLSAFSAAISLISP